MSLSCIWVLLFSLSYIPTGEGDRKEVSKRWADVSVHAEPRRLVRRESPAWVSETSPLSPRRKTFLLSVKRASLSLPQACGDQSALQRLWPSMIIRDSVFWLDQEHQQPRHLWHWHIQPIYTWAIWYIQPLYILCWLQHQLCSNCRLVLPLGAGTHTQNPIQHCGIWIWLYIICSKASKKSKISGKDYWLNILQWQNVHFTTEFFQY